MKLRFLGTGTSTGVPQIGCDCATCTSSDPHDKRLRCSALVTLDNGKNLLIDCGPDFRQQIIEAGAPELEALLVSHSHYDHVGGIDDLRPYCKDGRHFPTYCSRDVDDDLRLRNPWSFAAKLYPGVPTFAIHDVEPYVPFEVAGTTVIPLDINHGKLHILGYRIGQLGYVTDCSLMPERTIEALRGIDTLVINGLRFIPHPSHFTIPEALEAIAAIGPRQAYITHISHDMGLHRDIKLPVGVELAYDGLEIDIPDNSTH